MQKTTSRAEIDDAVKEATEHYQWERLRDQIAEEAGEPVPPVKGSAWAGKETTRPHEETQKHMETKDIWAVLIILVLLAAGLTSNHP